MKEKGEKNKKAIFNKWMKRFIVVLVVVLFIFALFFENINKYIPFKDDTVNYITEVDDISPYIEHKRNQDDIKIELQEIKEILMSREQDIEKLNNKVESLNREVENKVVNLTRYNSIRIALEIQNNIRNFKSYSANLENFKLIVIPHQIKDEIKFLEDNVNYDLTEQAIINNFKMEFNEFKKETNLIKNKNGYLKLLSKFIIIRNKKDSNLDIFVMNLKNSIDRYDYKTAERILDNSAYSELFVRTKKNLSLYNGLFDSINKIILFLVGGNE
jgi:hypothetical protein